MKFEEALKAMREGKKVKIKHHGDNSFKLWIRNGFMRLGMSEKFSIHIKELPTDTIVSEDWEIVDENR